MLLIPPGDFSAYLFDCDGTIADSMPLHFRAWTAALAEWGSALPEDLFYAWAGVPVEKVVERLNERNGTKLPAAAVAGRREEHYLRLLPEITAKAAVRSEILRAHGKNIPMAVVSGSPRASVVKTLNFLHLLHYFPTIVGAEDCVRGKPAPDPFLLAAERLGVEPARCLVFEDAELGIASARAAGMSWVKVD